jgi:AraC family transcriptional regulator, positive regulator of tynA and feaB
MCHPLTATPQQLHSNVNDGQSAMLSTSSTNHLAGYRRSVAALVARVDALPGNTSSFNCHISSQVVGPVRLVEIQSDAVVLRRSQRCIDVDPSSQYIIALQRVGRGSIRHDGIDIAIEPGTISLLDKALPYEAEFYQRAERLLVCVSRLHLERRLHDPDRYLKAVVRSDCGIARMASEFAECLFKEAPYLDEAGQLTAAAVCLDLLASALLSSAQVEARALTPNSIRRSNSAALLSRIKAYIRGHLCDPELNPEMIARAHNISKRYLHTLFAMTGTSVGIWIREQRLNRAYSDLANSRLQDATVTDIALRHGFNDAPHFSRKFKAKYGMTPNSARRLERRPQDL